MLPLVKFKSLVVIPSSKLTLALNVVWPLTIPPLSKCKYLATSALNVTLLTYKPVKSSLVANFSLYSESFSPIVLFNVIISILPDISSSIFSLV